MFSIVPVNPAQALFGPDYAIAISEDLGKFVVTAGKNSVDATYPLGDGRRIKVLPPGGYLINYISGAFAGRLGSGHKVGGQGGLAIRWRRAHSNDWTLALFPGLGSGTPSELEILYKSADLASAIFWIEFTAQHELLLVPPPGSAGKVTVSILRYVPRHLIHTSLPAILSMVSGLNVEAATDKISRLPVQT